MRLAVFSDVHGNFTALEAVLADLESVGEVDLIWCLGDLAAFGPQPAECVSKVRELKEQYGKEKFKVVGGNTDRYIVTGKRPDVPAAKDAEDLQKHQQNFQQRDDILNWSLAQLSWDDYKFLSKIIGRETRTHVDGYGTIIGFHAIPGDDEAPALKPDTADEEAADALLDRAGRLAIAGHTHLTMDRTVGNWRVLNPGSAGLSFNDATQAEWLLITVEDGTATTDFRKVAFDVDAAIAQAEAVGYPHLDHFKRPFKRA